MSDTEKHIKLLKVLIKNLEDKQSVSYNPRLDHVLGLMRNELGGIINFTNDETNSWVFNYVDDQI